MCSRISVLAEMERACLWSSTKCQDRTVAWVRGKGNEGGGRWEPHLSEHVVLRLAVGCELDCERFIKGIDTKRTFGRENRQWNE